MTQRNTGNDWLPRWRKQQLFKIETLWRILSILQEESRAKKKRSSFLKKIDQTGTWSGMATDITKRSTFPVPGSVIFFPATLTESRLTTGALSRSKPDNPGYFIMFRSTSRFNARPTYFWPGSPPVSTSKVFEGHICQPLFNTIPFSGITSWNA